MFFTGSFVPFGEHGNYIEKIAPTNIASKRIIIKANGIWSSFSLVMFDLF
jgi:hypothetical protein